MNFLLGMPLWPSLCVFAAVTMATYVVLDFFGQVSTRYRDRYLEETRYELDDILIQMPPGRVLDFSLGLSATSFLITILIAELSGTKVDWRGEMIVATVLALIVFPMPRLVLRYLWKKRLKKFNEQLEDVLMGISSSLKAGFSIAQAIEEVAENALPPISIEFRLLAQETRLGVPLTQALENMNKRLGSVDFELVATAIITARQTGGELTSTLERLAGLIRERTRINSKLHAMTSMGRLQAIMISAMPFLLLLGIYQVSPSLMEGVFDGFIGYAMLLVVIILVTIGFLVIRKITTIDI